MLKAKINSGELFVERIGGFKRQCCPKKEKVLECGTWCPLFGEVEDLTVDVEINEEERVEIRMPVPPRDLYKTEVVGKKLSICEGVVFEIVEGD